MTLLSNDCNKPNDSVVEYGLTLATIMKNTITISLSSASYVSWQRGAACVCCCAPFCGAAAAERRAAAIDRRLLPAGPTAANPRSNVRRPHDGTDGRADRRTDGRTDAIPLHRPSCSAYCADSATKDDDDSFTF